MNVCLDAFGTEEAEFLGRDGREESVAHKIYASNSHVLKSRLCERDRDKVQSCAVQNGLVILLSSSTPWKNRIAFEEVRIGPALLLTPTEWVHCETAGPP